MKMTEVQQKAKGMGSKLQNLKRATAPVFKYTTGCAIG